MWEAIVKLYQDPSENRKMILKEKLRTIKMQKGKGITSYVTKLQNVRDELRAVGEKPDEKNLCKLL